MTAEGPRISPEREAQPFQEHIALQARLNLGIDALNPANKELEFINPNIGADVISVVGNASKNERAEYWANKNLSFEQQKEAWTQGMVRSFAKKKDFFASEQGQRWVSLYTYLGINAQEFSQADAANFYDTYFAGGDAAGGVEKFVDKIQAHYKEKSYEQFRAEGVDAVAWLANVFGNKFSGEIVANLTDVSMRDDGIAKEAFVASVNKKDDVTSQTRLNTLTPREQELLQFLWDNKGDVVKAAASPTPSAPQPQASMLKRIGGPETPWPEAVNPQSRQGRDVIPPFGAPVTVVPEGSYGGDKSSSVVEPDSSALESHAARDELAKAAFDTFERDYPRINMKQALELENVRTEDVEKVFSETERDVRPLSIYRSKEDHISIVDFPDSKEEDSIAVRRRGDGAYDIVLADGVSGAVFSKVGSRAVVGAALDNLRLGPASLDTIVAAHNALQHRSQELVARGYVNNILKQGEVKNDWAISNYGISKRELLDKTAAYASSTMLIAAQYSPSGELRYALQGDMAIVHYKGDGSFEIVQGKMSDQLVHNSVLDQSKAIVGSFQVQPGEIALLQSDGMERVRGFYEMVGKYIKERVDKGDRDTLDVMVSEYIALLVKSEFPEDDVTTVVLGARTHTEEVVVSASVVSDLPPAESGVGDQKPIAPEASQRNRLGGAMRRSREASEGRGGPGAGRLGNRDIESGPSAPSQSSLPEADTPEESAKTPSSELTPEILPSESELKGFDLEMREIVKMDPSKFDEATLVRLEQDILRGVLRLDRNIYPENRRIVYQGLKEFLDKVDAVRTNKAWMHFESFKDRVESDLKTAVAELEVVGDATPQSDESGAQASSSGSEAPAPVDTDASSIPGPEGEERSFSTKQRDFINEINKFGKDAERFIDNGLREYIANLLATLSKPLSDDELGVAISGFIGVVSDVVERAAEKDWSGKKRRNLQRRLYALVDLQLDLDLRKLGDSPQESGVPVPPRPEEAQSSASAPEPAQASSPPKSVEDTNSK